MNMKKNKNNFKTSLIVYIGAIISSLIVIIFTSNKLINVTCGMTIGAHIILIVDIIEKKLKDR